MGGFACSDIVSSDINLKYNDVTLGFLDNDSFLDAAFATEWPATGGPEANLICSGDGMGGFACGLNFDTKPVNVDALGVASGNVNVGSSTDEIVFANAGRNVICFPCIDVSTETNFSQGVALGLVDGDGFLDAVFANEGLRNRVCIGDGAGGFSSCAVVSMETNNSRSVALGDFNPPPDAGCCVFGDNDCLDNQTEADCTAAGGIGFEMNTACSAVPQCDIPPPGEGCCVLGVNDCINDQTEDECNGAGGAIEIGLSCLTVSACMPQPSSLNRPIPTISQWGLIALAGILGIVGLIAIRKKYASV